MARCLRIQFPGALYHVTCRGNEKRTIFSDDRDRKKFLELVSESLETYRVILHAYVLMTNHFHLLVETPKGNLSEFMRHFNICYTGWYNYRHKRCGHLYQGRFKAFVIQRDAYLLAVSRYIHLNPAHPKRRNQGLEPVDCLAHPWSSLPGYLDEDEVQEFVDYDTTLSMAGGRVGYRKFVADGLASGVTNPFDGLKARAILGSDEFVALLRRERLGVGSSREQPAYRELMTNRIEPDQLMRSVAEILGSAAEKLESRGGDSLARGVACELLFRYSGLKQVEIGQLLGGIDYATVSNLRRALKTRLGREKEVRGLFEKAEDEVRRRSTQRKI